MLVRKLLPVLHTEINFDTGILGMNMRHHNNCNTDGNPDASI
jgi:hypothetical protein